MQRHLLSILFTFFILNSTFLLLNCNAYAAALTDNGNGTVTDSKTGLIWQQGEPGPMAWGTALSYCEGLSSLGGQSDWRLPNVKELKSLVDYSRYNPAIDKTYFPGAIASYYWSSTTYAHYPGIAGIAWYVYFHDGSVNSHNKVNGFYVRCVRGGQSGSFGSLTISKTGTGSGAVTSDPAGISCGATCTAGFAIDSTLTLTATTSTDSAFTGWSSDCAGVAPCILAMTTNKNVTANFTPGPKAKVLDTGYLTLTDAYTASGADATILAISEVLSGSLTLNQGKNVKIKGGYTSEFIEPPTGGPTVLSGMLTIQSGSLKVDKLTIK